MKTANLWILCALMTLLVACSDSSSVFVPPPPGILTVTVVDGSSSPTGPSIPIPNALILVIDAESGTLIETLTSNSSGQASGEYTQLNVQLKVTAQGFSPSPAEGVPPLPVSLIPGVNPPVTITLQPLDPALLIGSISGQISDHLSNPVAGALVIADDGSGANITSSSDADGNYLLHNVPAGNITLNAWFSGLNFPALGPVTLADDEALTGQDLTAAGTASGSISGHVSFTSISGDIIDITLLHPGSREVIPGLRSYTDGGANYQLSGVPNGTFEIIASLENDGYVIDPDTAVTQGIPVVTINNNAIIKDFKVTGSIKLTTPASATAYAPLPKLTATPTFSWLKDSSYASAEEYVIEVVDESSNTVWGGFGAAPAYTPQVTVPQGNTPSVAYNFDGTASVSPLETERVYQLRVYAKKSDAGDPRGYKLLSSSETLDGLFRVATP